MTITLYQFETCPFCAKVRAAFDEMGLEYEKVNVDRDRESEQRKDIAEKSGVATVPVADFDGTWVGDSDKIIEHAKSL